MAKSKPKPLDLEEPSLEVKAMADEVKKGSYFNYVKDVAEVALPVVAMSAIVFVAYVGVEALKLII